MKTKLILIASLVVAFVSSQPAVLAADVKAEMDQIVTSVRAKIKDGKTTAADLAPELKQFDDLLARHKDEKTDDVARVAFMKALLYVQVIKDEAKGIALLKDLKRDFADTESSKRVDSMIAGFAAQKEANKIKDALAIGSKFPDFQEKDLAGKPLSISGLKGKVVLVDFWATWCGPCIAELPNVLKAYEQHHAKGFEIVGISLDSDRAKLDSFIKKEKMTWAQFFDGQGWKNKLGKQYGINSIPATYLLDAEGKIIAKDLRGEALEKAVAKALGAQ